MRAERRVLFDDTIYMNIAASFNKIYFYTYTYYTAVFHAARCKKLVVAITYSPKRVLLSYCYASYDAKAMRQFLYERNLCYFYEYSKAAAKMGRRYAVRYSSTAQRRRLHRGD